MYLHLFFRVHLSDEQDDRQCLDGDWDHLRPQKAPIHHFRRHQNQQLRQSQTHNVLEQPTKLEIKNGFYLLKC